MLLLADESQVIQCERMSGPGTRKRRPVLARTYRRGPNVADSMLADRLLRNRRIASSGCWEWTGALASTGYGSLAWRSRYLTAHRAAYETWVGPIPDGHVVHHHCHNPGCFNPAHLEAISRKAHAAEHGLSGFAAMYAARESCARGHLLDAATRAKRGCKACNRERQAKWEAKKKGRGDAPSCG